MFVPTFHLSKDFATILTRWNFYTSLSNFVEFLRIEKKKDKKKTEFLYS